MPGESSGIKKMEAPPRFELGVKVLQTSALPLGYGAGYRPGIFACYGCIRNGADYGARTRHLDLGKVALYQMS